jgi:hypothetical protein
MDNEAAQRRHKNGHEIVSPLRGFHASSDIRPRADAQG